MTPCSTCAIRAISCLVAGGGVPDNPADDPVEKATGQVRVRLTLHSKLLCAVRVPCQPRRPTRARSRAKVIHLDPDVRRRQSEIGSKADADLPDCLRCLRCLVGRVT